MGTFIGSSVVRMLLKQSVDLAGRLRSQYASDLALPITEALERALASLQTESVSHAQSLLLLSSARQHIKSVERLVTERIIGDKWVPREEMLVLVDVRWGCHRAIHRLNDDMTGLRGR
jgi:hypothetical protein